MIPIQKKKLLVIIGIFILFVATVSVVYLFFNNSSTTNQSKNSSTVNIYTNPGHYEISKLLDLGITTNQLNMLKTYFSAYSSAQKTPVKEIVISLSSMKLTVNKNTGENKITFIVTTDRSSTLNAQASYFGLDDMLLNLYDSISGTRVYTSDSSGS